MRAEDPADRNIVNRVGHYGVAIALAVSRKGNPGAAQSVEIVLPEIELLLETQRPPLVTGARADVEAVVVVPSDLETAEPVGGIVQMRPAALDAEIGRQRPAWHHEPLGL